MEGKKHVIIASVFFVIGGVFIPSQVYAASLNFSPLAATRSVGDAFSVTVYAQSVDKALNAVSGAISFPRNILEVISISKTNSIINLWVQEPSFSNTEGIVNFEGIALNPGYTGSQGNIITINFRAKARGEANLNFSSGSILANDGLGTNILNDLGTGAFTIQSGSQTQTVPIAQKSADGAISIITSNTHPDQKKWYSNSSPEFSWVLPPDAIEVRTLIGSSPDGIPRVSYVPPIASKKVDPLSDGIYYFSLQVRTTNGWGEVFRYRVNIDTIPPEPFTVTFPHGTKTFESQPVILFNTIDITSSVSRYDVKVGSGEPERVAAPATSNPYPLPPQHPGTHTVVVTATDEAGNTRSASADFTIEGIDAPIITFYPEELELGDLLKIRGTTYPNSEITVLVKNADNNEVVSQEITKSNSLGDFGIIISKRLEQGTYLFTVRVTDARGAQSNETAPLTVVIKSKFLNDLINLTLDYLSAILLVMLSLALMIGGGIYIWTHAIKIIRKFRRESREAEKAVERSFTALRKEIAIHVLRLKSLKRKLTAEEVLFLERFEKELEEAEKTITKEIQDISHS
jgi:hypothetical protein